MKVTYVQQSVNISKFTFGNQLDATQGLILNTSPQNLPTQSKIGFVDFSPDAHGRYFFKWIILMGNNLNNLYLNGQVIWYGGSRDIVNFLQYLSYFQSNKRVN
jgi:hypothetical protein